MLLGASSTFLVLWSWIVFIELAFKPCNVLSLSSCDNDEIDVLSATVSLERVTGTTSYAPFLKIVAPIDLPILLVEDRRCVVQPTSMQPV